MSTLTGKVMHHGAKSAYVELAFAPSKGTYYDGSVRGLLVNNYELLSENYHDVRVRVYAPDTHPRSITFPKSLVRAYEILDGSDWNHQTPDEHYAYFDQWAIYQEV